jgi:hypothetical protein
MLYRLSVILAVTSFGLLCSVVVVRTRARERAPRYVAVYVMLCGAMVITGCTGWAELGEDPGMCDVLLIGADRLRLGIFAARTFLLTSTFSLIRCMALLIESENTFICCQNCILN